MRTVSVLLKTVKRAPTGRPFFWRALLCILPFVFVGGASAQCLGDAGSEIIEVARITDGDTVVLTDNRKVRIIGVNTAELNAKHPRSRSWATQGANAVRQWLANSKVVYLIEGKDKQDRHGRTLAHLRNKRGELLSEFLIDTGLAAATAVSPNTRCANHLYSLEGQARAQANGVWDTSNPWFVTKDKLTKNSHSGFRILQAQVSRVEKKNRRHELTLSNGLVVRLPNNLYKSLQSSLEPGNEIEVRGWVSFRNNRARLTLHHATNLRVL